MRTILRPSGDGSFAGDALRDIVIVVVGILAALWLESWWQDLEDRQEEKEILISLREEFSANASELENLIVTWTRVRQTLIEVVRAMGEPVDAQSVAAFRAAHDRDPIGPGKFFFDPRHGQLTSAISSGKLGLISDSDLRAMIADWPALVADHDFDEEQWIGSFIDNIAPLRVSHIGSGSASKFEGRHEELMQNRAYEGYISNQAGLLGRIILEGEEILATTDKIVQRIDAQLLD